MVIRHFEEAVSASVRFLRLPGLGHKVLRELETLKVHRGVVVRLGHLCILCQGCCRSCSLELSRGVFAKYSAIRLLVI